MIVPQASDGARMDVFLAQETGRTRSNIQKAIAAGGVRLNGIVVTKSVRVQAGDTVEAQFPWSTRCCGIATGSFRGSTA